MIMSSMSIETIRCRLNDLFELIRTYQQIVDSYVLDFYVEDHWEKLPRSWQLCFQSLEPPKLKELFDSKCPISVVWPLSLLAMRELSTSLCVSRIPQKVKNIISEPERNLNPNLKALFKKQIKLKKIHEIDVIAEVCSENAKKCSTNFVVDFGAGLGHLARRLTYTYGLKVCCIEMQEGLNKQARIIDDKFAECCAKNANEINYDRYSKPVHLTMKLSKDTTSEFFIQLVRKAFNVGDNANFAFGIVGLHPCGDLSAVLIKLFVQTTEAKYLNISGCCYMKLTTSIDSDSFATNGYPLSEFLKNRKESFFYLSYEAREAACHAIEHFIEKLKENDYSNQKIHCYRAIAERIIRSHQPSLRHIGLKNIKYTEDLSFQEYFLKATKDTGISVDITNLNSKETQVELGFWKRVVMYYVVRLLFSPLVESILLYDRLLHLIEEGCEASIQAVFNPTVSPRNHLLIGLKR